MAKQPYIPLYTGDYLKDTRILPLEVRGAWIDIMIFMWESKEKGTITGTMDEFGSMLGCSPKKASTIISLLMEKGICDYEDLDGGKVKLISRRIVRDEEISKIRKEAGSKGGNPDLVNQNANQNESKNKINGYPVSDNDNAIGIPKEKESGKFSSKIDSYQSGKQAFQEIQQDAGMVERMLRTVQRAGYDACDEVTLMSAVRFFITREEAKPDFTLRTRVEFKVNLVNWITKYAKTLDQYART